MTTPEASKTTLTVVPPVQEEVKPLAPTPAPTPEAKTPAKKAPVKKAPAKAAVKPVAKVLPSAIAAAAKKETAAKATPAKKAPIAKAPAKTPAKPAAKATPAKAPAAAKTPAAKAPVGKLHRKVFGKTKRADDLETHVSLVTLNGTALVDVRDFVPSLGVTNGYGRGYTFSVDLLQPVLDGLVDLRDRDLPPVEASNG